MQRAAQIFAAVNFIVIGLSHIFQSRAWAEFFMALREKGRPGLFANGMLSLLVGSIIVALHNVWSGLAMVLTIVGWAQVLKGLLTLTVPTISARSLARVSMDRSWEFVAGGFVALAIGGLQLYLVLWG
jgi:uncharacterized protein YjeT (DUF2065 family)